MGVLNRLTAMFGVFQMLDVDGPVPQSRAHRAMLAQHGNAADGNYDDQVYGKLATPTVMPSHHLARMASRWGPECGGRTKPLMTAADISSLHHGKSVELACIH